MCKTQKSDEQVNTHWDIEFHHWFKKLRRYRIDIGIGRYSEFLVSDRYRFWKSSIEPALIYTLAPSITQAVKEIQIAFQSLEDALVSLKLVLNSQNTKFMVFSKAQAQVSKS